MDGVEVQLLAGRSRATANIRQTTLISLLITLAVASALFIALFRAIHHEMAARRDAEHALRASEQYNRSIVDSSPDCLAVLTPDARVSQMTPQGMKLLGIDEFASVADSDWFELWSGEDRAAAQSALAAARDGSAGTIPSIPSVSVPSVSVPKVTVPTTVSGPYWASQLAQKLGYAVNQGEPYYFGGCTNSSQCVLPNALIPQTAWSAPAASLLKYIPTPNNANGTFSTSASPI